ncbi:MAG: amidohydrolase, partial [Flavobacteriaceae bacterium]
MKTKNFILSVLMLSCIYLQAQKTSNYNGEGPFKQLIIRGVTLINGNGAPPKGPVDIVVENNVIKSIKVVGYPGLKIDPKDRPKLKPGGKELDANGMYLLPGFIDAHVHIGGVPQGAEPEYVFRLWMAHGVTSVREVSGRGLNFTLKLKKQSAAHKIVAPRIFAYTR